MSVRRSNTLDFVNSLHTTAYINHPKKDKTGIKTNSAEGKKFNITS